jgi:hypothetical protein
MMLQDSFNVVSCLKYKQLRVEMGMQLWDMGENNEMSNSTRRCYTSHSMIGGYYKEKFIRQGLLNVGCFLSRGAYSVHKQ